MKTAVVNYDDKSFKFVIQDENEYIQKTLLTSGKFYEKDLLESLTKLIDVNEGVALDIGANLGNHSIFFAGVLGLQVHSFEPLAQTYNLLQQNIKINEFENKIFTNNSAVGAENGWCEIENVDQANLGSTTVSRSQNGKIPLVTIDSYLSEINFSGNIKLIKIDVEGFEVSVLNGAMKTIKLFKPLLIIECQNMDRLYEALTVLKNDYFVYDVNCVTPTFTLIHKSYIDNKLIESNNGFGIPFYINKLLSYNSAQNNINLKYRKVSEGINDYKHKLEESHVNTKIMLEKISVLTASEVNLKHNLNEANNKYGISTEQVRDLEIKIEKIQLEKIALNERLNLAQEDIIFSSAITLPEAEFIKILKSLRIACIMDDFSFTSFKHECDLLQISPANWFNELNEFNPQLLFIESAWRGKDGLWDKKVGHISDEIKAILSYCKERSIPTIFWNKEDPVHFETFINLATLFDYIFTTDIDCVSRYKQKLKHNHVYFLPFACQPQINNPIEKYNRKDAFCFAGAYYVRYPERTTNLADFVFNLNKFRPFDIYDRNYYSDDINYKFPAEYRFFIVGNLKYDKIDLAYKGYKYAVNMNSIKQSQTMFARRAYELLASNTLTVSNYSRGIRLMFGELVVTSDDGNELLNRLKKLEHFPYYEDKLKLAGLRKAMSEHTYQDRLAFVYGKCFNIDVPNLLPSVVVFAKANNEHECLSHIENFTRQEHSKKKLILIINNSLSFLVNNIDCNIRILFDDMIMDTQISNFVMKHELVAFFSPNDYYGKSYLLDFAIATRFTTAPTLSKINYFYFENQKVLYCANQATYTYFDGKIYLFRSVMYIDQLGKQQLQDIVTKVEEPLIVKNVFIINPFNYCNSNNVSDFNDQSLKLVNDLALRTGLSMEMLHGWYEKSSFSYKDEDVINDDLSFFDGRLIFNSLTNAAKSENTLYTMMLDDNKLIINSMLDFAKHHYIYLQNKFSICDVCDGTVLKLHFMTSPGLNLQIVVKFFDKDNQPTGHQVLVANKNHEVIISENSANFILGMRIYASGAARVDGVLFGHRNIELPNLIGTTKTLLVTNNYPSYSDLYRNGFVHSRVKLYRENNVNVDVFKFKENITLNFDEFQDVDVTTGGTEALTNILSNNFYQNILVHFLDDKIWQVIKDELDNTRVFVWIHGAEIQPWHRREYNFVNDEELSIAKIDSDKRIKFWQEIMSNIHPNLHFIFVSQYFANEVMEDVNIQLPCHSYSVIHNPINIDLFSYVTKTAEQRKKILSIRTYASKKYGNDLSVAAILELSKKSYFSELEIKFIGDGKLFEETLLPLRQFKNVIIEQKFLKQDEIASLQKEFGIFLCPTRWDSQGVSKDEAMSSGLVVVTNNVAAISEFIDNTCGVLALKEDYITMANGIAELIENPAVFLEKSVAASQRVRRQTSNAIVIPQELQLFHAI
ncbi:MAG: FkbM family methyltransferase [Burkholderiales bacterium]|nr:FkbM family methyltransferase [Burkholderiales bacterium]